MKFVFFAIPAYGHLNPALGVIHELIAGGHEVVVYCTEEFREKIESVGAKFVPPPVPVEKIDMRIIR